jgi:predicted RNase H-like nuclease (RuvC/YqgF family)
MKNKDKECDKANCGIQQDDYESVELGEEHFTRPEPELSLLPEQKTARSRAAASGGSPSADRLAALERELNKLKVSVTALKKENATLKECITQLQEQVFEDEAEDEEADEAGEEADEAEEEADEEEE